MFHNEQYSEELNMIMGAIVDKQEVLPYDETNNVQLKQEIYQ